MFKYFLKAMSAFGWPIWIAFIGGGLGMLGGLGGVLVTRSISAVAIYIVIVIGFFFIFWKFMFGPMAQHERLMDIGVDADATIVSITENGSSLQIGGALPKAGMRIVLNVTPRDRSPFQATLNTFVSMFEIGKYSPGKKIRVKFDPNKPQDLTIAEGTSSTGMYSA